MACAVLVQFVDPRLDCAAEATANVPRWRAHYAPPLPAVALDPAALPRYAGAYRRANGATAHVVIYGGRLR